MPDGDLCRGRILRRAGRYLFEVARQTLRPASVLGWLAVPLLVSLTGAHTVSADGVYAQSNPRPGQVFAKAPRRIAVSLTTRLDARSRFTITVTGPNGARIDDGGTVAVDSTATRFSTGLPDTLLAGRYLVRFQTETEIGDTRQSGAFSFYVGVVPTVQQRTLDGQMMLLRQAEEQPSQTGSDMLAATGAGFAASAVCGAVGLALCGIARRRLPHTEPSSAADEALVVRGETFWWW